MTAFKADSEKDSHRGNLGGQARNHERFDPKPSGGMVELRCRLQWLSTEKTSIIKQQDFRF